MQAVILAAGRGKRMGALTENMPKPMLTLLGNNLIEHKLLILPPQIDEIVIVIGYLGEKIRQHFGNDFQGKKISYIEQNEPLGTGHAIAQAKHILRGSFLVMMGDDIYDKEDLARSIQHKWSIMIKKVEKPGKGARVSVDKNDHLTDIVEAAELQPGDAINTGLYTLHADIFSYPPVKIDSGEYGLPQVLVKAAQDKIRNNKVVIFEATNWHQITSPEDLAAFKG